MSRAGSSAGGGADGGEGKKAGMFTDGAVPPVVSSGCRGAGASGRSPGGGVMKPRSLTRRL